MQNKVLKSVLVVIGVLVIIYGLYVLVTKYGRISPPPVSSEIGNAFDRGDFDQVIALSNEVLKQDPKNVYAILFLSQTYAQKGSLEFKEKELGQKAVDYANQALALDPNNAKVYVALGYANEIMQKYDEAIAAYTKSISLDSKSVDGYVRRGHAYDLSGNLVKAREDYLKAASIDANNPQVAQNLGRIYARSGDTVKALEQFTIVASTSANTRLKAEAYYNLSALAFYGTSTDSLKQSLAYASSSLATDPTYPQAYFSLGRVYVAQGNFIQAATMLNKAISLYPNFSAAYEWQANMYAKMGKSNEAISAYETEKTVSSQDISLMENEKTSLISHASFNQATLYAQIGQKDKAISALQESINSADPVTLMVLQFSLQGASTNDFKTLTNYQPFKDLVQSLNSKVEAELNKLKNQKSSSLFQTIKSKLSSLAENLKPEKAIAATFSCGATSGGTITGNNNGGSVYEDSLAHYFCAVLTEHLNGDDSRLSNAILTAKAVDPNYAGGFYTNYNQVAGEMFLGCANGVGATYVPVAQAISPSGTLACNTSSVNLSWLPVPNAYYYNIRVDNQPSSWANASTCAADNVNGDLCQDAVYNTYYNNYAVNSGHSYHFWLDPTQRTWVPQVDGHFEGTYPNKTWVPQVDGHWTYSNIGTRSTDFRVPACTQGSCGSANGASYSSAPSSNLCTVGQASSVSGSGPWTWTCGGVDGGSPSGTCTANKNQVLSATCSVSPGTASTTQTVTWTAHPAGGNNSYTYSWSGTDISGTNASSTLQKIYSSTGSKSATVTVTSGGVSTTTSPCVNSISGSTGGDGTGHGIDISNSTDGVCVNYGHYDSIPTDPNLCVAGDAGTISGTGSSTNPWSWYCAGRSGGATSPQCTALKNATTPTILTCSISLQTHADSKNQVAVNTNTTWSVSPSISGGYTKVWTVNGVEVDPSQNGGDTLDQIFTTLGLKTVSLSFSSGTAPTAYCDTNNSSATTSVVLPGDLNEI